MARTWGPLNTEKASTGSVHSTPSSISTTCTAFASATIGGCAASVAPGAPGEAVAAGAAGTSSFCPVPGLFGDARAGLRRAISAPKTPSISATTALNAADISSSNSSGGCSSSAACCEGSASGSGAFSSCCSFCFFFPPPSFLLFVTAAAAATATGTCTLRSCASLCRRIMPFSTSNRKRANERTTASIAAGSTSMRAERACSWSIAEGGAADLSFSRSVVGFSSSFFHSTHPYRWRRSGECCNTTTRKSFGRFSTIDSAKGGTTAMRPYARLRAESCSSAARKAEQLAWGSQCSRTIVAIWFSSARSRAAPPSREATRNVSMRDAYDRHDWYRHRCAPRHSR
eukprot:Opistho-1_new@50220